MQRFRLEFLRTFSSFSNEIIIKLRLICYCYSKLSNLTLHLSKVTCLSPCSWEGLILVLSGLLYDSWPACLKLRRKLYWGSQRLSFKKKLPESAWWVLSWDCCALLKKARQYELLSSNDLRSASQFCALLKLSRIFTLTRAGVWRKILVWLKILIKNFSRENCDSEFLLKNVGISRISVN